MVRENEKVRLKRVKWEDPTTFGGTGRWCCLEFGRAWPRMLCWERERESRWRQPPMWRWWWEAVRDCARALAIVVVANERVGWRVVCVWEIYKMFYTYFKHKTFYMILPQFYGWPFFYNKTSTLNLMDDSMKWGALIYI